MPSIVALFSERGGDRSMGWSTIAESMIAMSE